MAKIMRWVHLLSRFVLVVFVGIYGSEVALIFVVLWVKRIMRRGLLIFCRRQDVGVVKFNPHELVMHIFAGGGMRLV